MRRFESCRGHRIPGAEQAFPSDRASDRGACCHVRPRTPAPGRSRSVGPDSNSPVDRSTGEPVRRRERRLRVRRSVPAAAHRLPVRGDRLTVRHLSERRVEKPVGCAVVTEMPSVARPFRSDDLTLRQRHSEDRVFSQVATPKYPGTFRWLAARGPRCARALVKWRAVETIWRFRLRCRGVHRASIVAELDRSWPVRYPHFSRMHASVTTWYRIGSSRATGASPVPSVTLHTIYSRSPPTPPNPLIGICVSPILSTGSGDGAAQ